MAALTVLCGLVNSLPTVWMEKLTRTYVIFHVLVLVSCAIALLAKTENKHDATYVFTDKTGSSGWNPPGFAWLFGFLSVSWTMTDYDATAHITEEISNPEIKAPFAIFWAMAFTYIAGFLFNIVLAFCMGDPAEILASPIAQPVAQIFYNSLGKSGGIFYTVCAFMILQFVCFTATQALARTFFAFSRDRLIPGSRYWVKIERRTGIPLNAVWITIFWCIALNLIALGNYTVGLLLQFIRTKLTQNVNRQFLASLTFVQSALIGPTAFQLYARFSSIALNLDLGIWVNIAFLSIVGPLSGQHLFQ
jgi:amino acid transporter